MQLGQETDPRITNLRFADDILLIGRSLPQVKQMLADIAIEGKKIGLELHPEKTKIMHNNIGYGSLVRNANIAGMDIEVLDGTAETMYLGRALSLTNTHEVELKHRIKKAWAKFGIYRQELTDRAIPLHLRLKLFQSVVPPTILYGCSSWVMTVARETLLRSTEMKMLRAIMGRRRLESETWVEWIQRATHQARQAMEQHHIPDWVGEQRQRRTQWAERVSRTTDERWTQKVLQWHPEGRRSRGHPRARWTDQL